MKKLIKNSGRIAIFIQCTLLFAVFLPNLDSWLYNNDPLNNLATGYPSSEWPESTYKFYEAAVANCYASITDQIEAKGCVEYQKNMTIDVFYNYPIVSFIGGNLASNTTEHKFSEQALDAARLATTLGVGLSLFIYFLLMSCLPRQIQWAVAGIIGLGVAGMHFVKIAPGINTFDPLIMKTNDWGAQSAAIAVILIGFMTLAFKKNSSSPLRPFKAPFERLQLCFTKNSTLLVMALLSIALASFLLRVIGIVPEATTLIALGIFIGGYILVARQADMSLAESLAIGVLLYICINQAHIHILLQLSRGQMYLVWIGFFIYMTVSPKGPLIWLFPVMGLFHVSVFSLMSVALFLAESIVCLLTKQGSRILLVSGISSIVGFSINQLRPKGDLTDIAGIDYFSVIFSISQSPILIPTVLTLGLLCCFVIVFTRSNDDRYKPMIRIAVLVGLLVGTEAVKEILNNSNTLNTYHGGLYVITRLSEYMGPPISMGSAFAILAFLVTQINKPSGIIGQNNGTQSFSAFFSTNMLAVVSFISVFTLMVAKAPPASTYRAQWLDEILHGLKIVIGQEEPRNWRRGLECSGEQDDVYCLRTSDPINDPIIYLSLLKMKVRAVQGRLNEKSMNFIVINDEE